MERNKIERINFLAKKAKGGGLTEKERQEQAELRAEYLAAVRKNLRVQLENIKFREE